MKMFRNGYWQKLVLLLTILAELALVTYFIVKAVIDGATSQASSVTVMTLLILIQAFVCIFIVQTDSAAQYKIVWLVFVGALPVVGVTFYLLFAHKLRTRRESKTLKMYYEALKHDPSTDETRRKLAASAPDCANIANYIEQASNGGIYQNTSVSYFPLGDVAFPVMLRELEKAKHYIFLEYFIIKPGKFWDSILDILVKKAKEGIDVRVVYDDMGNLGATPVHYWRYLRKLGLNAHAFARINPILY